MIGNIVMGLASAAMAAGQKNKSTSVNFEKTAAPNLKMMDSTYTSNAKEGVVSNASSLLNAARTRTLNASNAASGMRTGKTFSSLFDTQSAIAANTASAMNDIDAQALNFNNSVMSWIADFNLRQNSAAADVAQNNTTHADAAANANSANLSGGLSNLSQIFLSKDKDGNYVYPIGGSSKKNSSVDTSVVTRSGVKIRGLTD